MRGGVSVECGVSGGLLLSSPRAWGCFLQPRHDYHAGTVFPTCVGVFPPCFCRSYLSLGLPHVRGGVSFAVRNDRKIISSSPRAWGCFFSGVFIAQKFRVFPTCVGVFLRWLPPRLSCRRLPHVRGGVSVECGVSGGLLLSSPRAWGCFLQPRHDYHAGTVFPTCVGVFPPCFCRSYLSLGLPHVRGGVSFAVRNDRKIISSSPRAWGCFFSGVFIAQKFRVFPTCVGVFPIAIHTLITDSRLPHVRGGVSRMLIFRGLHSVVFPTCVGVFLVVVDVPGSGRCLPHVRGGVSFVASLEIRTGSSSPRAWGCFLLSGKKEKLGLVFPTCVGGFPAHGQAPWGQGRLPHVRGGVSEILEVGRASRPSSPRAWGCFGLGTGDCLHCIVFPTCVGVFLTGVKEKSLRCRLPHVRGGVSSP